MNNIIGGKYHREGSGIAWNGHKIVVVYLKGFRFKEVTLNKENVEEVRIIDRGVNLSLGSSIGRGLVGGALLGGVGALGGILTAKRKESFTLEIKYKDGEKSLALVDELLLRRFITEFEVI